MTDKVMDIGERISCSLQDSLNELYLLRREEGERLKGLKEREGALTLELRELAAAVDKSVEDYGLSRAELVRTSRRGEISEEKISYERASELKKVRDSLEERYRLLNAQKDGLTREKRHLERLIAKSENMGNRLRMVLLLFDAPEDFAASDASHDPDCMKTAFHLAEQEAAAFARELHDGPTQTFSAVGLTLEMCQEYLNRAEYRLVGEELARALEQARCGLDEMRAFLFNLNPTGIEDGFDLPLKRLAAQLSQMWKCGLTYSLSGDLDGVSANVRVGAFKTLHQAVLNAARHGATEVKVAVNRAKRALRVHVTDNGKGFDVEAEREAAKERGSYGLVNMEARVKMLGGKISIASVLKKGTNVSFSIPL